MELMGNIDYVVTLNRAYTYICSLKKQLEKLRNEVKVVKNLKITICILRENIRKLKQENDNLRKNNVEETCTKGTSENLSTKLMSYIAHSQEDCGVRLLKQDALSQTEDQSTISLDDSNKQSGSEEKICGVDGTVSTEVTSVGCTGANGQRAIDISQNNDLMSYLVYSQEQLGLRLSRKDPLGGNDDQTKFSWDKSSKTDSSEEEYTETDETSSADPIEVGTSGNIGIHTIGSSGQESIEAENLQSVSACLDDDTRKPSPTLSSDKGNPGLPSMLKQFKSCKHSSFETEILEQSSRAALQTEVVEGSISPSLDGPSGIVDNSVDPEETAESKPVPSRASYLLSILGRKKTAATRKSIKASRTVTKLKEAPEKQRFSCEECGKSFTTSSILKRHSQIHSRDKSLSCPLCRRTFREREALDDHIATHPNLPYSCEECGKRFRNHHHLARHILVHSGERPFACGHCDKTFTQKVCLKKHEMLKHTGEEMPFVCQECGKGFKLKEALRAHLQKKHDSNIRWKGNGPGMDPNSLLCIICGKSFPKRLNLRLHMSTHTKEKPYGCQECGKKFRIRQHLAQHILVHSGERPFLCGHCGKTFTQKARLKKHETLEHTGEETPFLCQECGRGFKLKEDLRTHIQKHTGNYDFLCNVCGKGFSLKHNLTKHQHTHSQIKPFQCGECGKGFIQKHQLERHNALHTGVRPFVCTRCGHKFACEANLNSHMLCHSTERPHVCDQCGCAFTRKLYLKRHTFLHTGQKPFSCTYCGKSFAIKSNLTQHIAIHNKL